jgi:hypothetical protein
MRCRRRPDGRRHWLRLMAEKSRSPSVSLHHHLRLHCSPTSPPLSTNPFRRPRFTSSAAGLPSLPSSPSSRSYHPFPLLARVALQASSSPVTHAPARSLHPTNLKSFVYHTAATIPYIWAPSFRSPRIRTLHQLPLLSTALAASAEVTNLSGRCAHIVNFLG